VLARGGGARGPYPFAVRVAASSNIGLNARPLRCAFIVS